MVLWCFKTCHQRTCNWNKVNWQREYSRRQTSLSRQPILRSKRTSLIRNVQGLNGPLASKVDEKLLCIPTSSSSLPLQPVVPTIRSGCILQGPLRISCRAFAHVSCSISSRASHSRWLWLHQRLGVIQSGPYLVVSAVSASALHWIILPYNKQGREGGAGLSIMPKSKCTSPFDKQQQL